MAFSLNSSSGLRRARVRGNPSPAEINIVPLVDVVLVLLIIFMLTAHVMDYGLEVEVPKVKITKENNDVLPVVAIRSNETLFLNEKPVNIHDLPAQLTRRFKDQKTVYVAADKSVKWDLLAQVFAELSEAKFTVRAVTKPTDARGK